MNIYLEGTGNTLECTMLAFTMMLEGRHPPVEHKGIHTTSGHTLPAIEDCSLIFLLQSCLSRDINIYEVT